MVQIIPWTGYIKTIFKRARINQNQGAYIYKRPDQNIYMSCHESFHTPEQNSQLNCTRWPITCEIQILSLMSP